MGDALKGATQKQIRDKRQENRNNRRLARVERVQHLPLVDDIHDDAKNQDARRRDDSLPETSAPPLGVPNTVDQGPNIWPASEPRVMKPVAKRGDDRHRRLQDEAKHHRTGRPIKNVAPKTAETFSGHPVPSHPEGEETKYEQECDTRQ